VVFGYTTVIRRG